MEKLSTRLEYPNLAYLKEHMLDRNMWKKEYLLFDTKNLKIKAYLANIDTRFSYATMCISPNSNNIPMTLQIPFNNPEYREQKFESDLFNRILIVIEREELTAIKGTRKYIYLLRRMNEAKAKKIFERQKQIFKESFWESYENIFNYLDMNKYSNIAEILNDDDACDPYNESQDLDIYVDSQTHSLYKNYYDLLLSLIKDEKIRKEMEERIYGH